jgi:hypothetical protein
MARNSLLASGEIIVELDPSSIEDAPIADRMEPEDERFRLLRDSIAKSGHRSVAKNFGEFLLTRMDELYDEYLARSVRNPPDPAFHAALRLLPEVDFTGSGAEEDAWTLLVAPFPAPADTDFCPWTLLGATCPEWRRGGLALVGARDAERGRRPCRPPPRAHPDRPRGRAPKSGGN